MLQKKWKLATIEKYIEAAFETARDILRLMPARSGLPHAVQRKGHAASPGMITRITKFRVRESYQVM